MPAALHFFPNSSTPLMPNSGEVELQGNSVKVITRSCITLTCPRHSIQSLQQFFKVERFGKHGQSTAGCAGPF